MASAVSLNVYRNWACVIICRKDAILYTNSTTKNVRYKSKTGQIRVSHTDP